MDNIWNRGVGFETMNKCQAVTILMYCLKLLALYN